MSNLPLVADGVADLARTIETRDPDSRRIVGALDELALSLRTMPATHDCDIGAIHLCSLLEGAILRALPRHSHATVLL